MKLSSRWSVVALCCTGTSSLCDSRLCTETNHNEHTLEKNTDIMSRNVYVSTKHMGNTWVVWHACRAAIPILQMTTPYLRTPSERRRRRRHEKTPVVIRTVRWKYARERENRGWNHTYAIMTTGIWIIFLKIYISKSTLIYTDILSLWIAWTACACFCCCLACGQLSFHSLFFLPPFLGAISGLEHPWRRMRCTKRTIYQDERFSLLSSVPSFYSLEDRNVWKGAIPSFR